MPHCIGPVESQCDTARRKPWQVIMICYIPVLLSLFVLPFVPMYVDTGTNAIFARKTTISNRINSGDIIRQILPKKPNNVTAGLEDNVQQLVANYSTQAERSDTVFGDAVCHPCALDDHRQELNDLVFLTCGCALGCHSQMPYWHCHGHKGTLWCLVCAIVWCFQTGAC